MVSRKHKAPSPSPGEAAGTASMETSPSAPASQSGQTGSATDPASAKKKPRLASRAAAAAEKAEKPLSGSQAAPHAPIRVAPRRSVPGDVFVCGTGDCGQLGLGEDVSEKPRPAILRYFDDLDVIDVVAGGMHNLVLTASGEVHSWGCNDDGALGRVTRKHSEDEMLPGKVQGLEGVKIVRLAAGDSVSAALSEDGFVYAWGTFRSSNGILGLDETLDTKSSLAPLQLSPRTLKNIIDIAAGTNHIIALQSSGRILTWGSGEQNQLGRRCSPRDLKLALRPTDVTFIRPATDARYASAVADMHHHQEGSSTGSSPSISPYASPSSKGTVSTASSPANTKKRAAGVAAGATQRDALASTRGPFLGVFAGGYHSFVLTRNFQVWACGLNNYGQTGGGTADQFSGVFRVPRLSFPVEIPGHSSNDHIVHIAAGEHHSLATTSTGRVFVFGRSDSAQLGLPLLQKQQQQQQQQSQSDSPTTDLTAAFAETSIGAFKSVPVLHPTLHDIALCGAAGQWSAAVGRDGQLFTWGYGEQGQLATGEFQDEATPVPVQLKARKVLALGCGGQHMVMLLSKKVEE